MLLPEQPLSITHQHGEWILQKKLIVPEINATSLTKEDKIIANPNCSTIQMLVLAPLHKNTILNVVVSTYQSITEQV
jgi:aspartate-semialdehyde dehydrogenase